MRLISLILSVTAFCNAWASGQENYSLWPRRPAELEQAQALIRKHDYDQAIRLLTPFLYKNSLSGHEARQLVSDIRVRDYLSPKHPRIRIHTVRRGENVERIATAYKSAGDLIILINAMLDPSDLKVGQRLLVAPMDLRAELNLHSREITVWDGRTLVAAYDVLPSADLISGANEETRLQEREGEVNGARVPRTSAVFTTSNRLLKLGNGILLVGGSTRTKNKVVLLQQRDVNELSMLLGIGARVSIVRDDKTFDPYLTPAAALEEPPAKGRNK